MDQELQFLINTLYGNKLNEKQLAGIMQMAQLNPQYLLNMRNAANAKMPGSKLDMSNIRANNIASLRTPTLGRIDFNHFTANKGIAKNDMSAVDDFKLAFRLARQGGHKTFFWKKTKANPSGMFSTETKPQGYDGSVKVNNNKVFLDTDKTDIPAFTGQYPEQFDVNSPRIPIQGPIQHAQIDDPNFIPRIPILGKTDLGIFKKQNPVEVNVSGGNNRIAGRKYGEGQKNANLYFGRKGMFANGGNIQGQSSTPLIGNSGASIADVITIINSKDMNAIQELFSSIGLEGFEQAIRGILQMAESGDGSALQALQTLLELMLGSQKAKLGTKLAYIQKLKGICPEGTEKVYLAKGGCMCSRKAQNGGKTKMPTKYDEKRHERLAIGEAMGKNNKAQQDSLLTYRNLYNNKSASDKYKMGDLDPHGKNPKKKVLEKGCGGKTLVNRKKKK